MTYRRVSGRAKSLGDGMTADVVESESIVQTVLLNDSTGKLARVPPYLQIGFFQLASRGGCLCT